MDGVWILWVRLGHVTGAGDRKLWFLSPALWLLQSDYANDDGDVVDAADGQLEGFVCLVVGDDEDVLGIATPLDALDEGSLVGIEHIYFVPLKEEICHGDTLAGHDVARTVFGVHARPFDWNEEVSSLEYGHYIAIAFVLQHALLACERTRHGIDGYEWYAFLGVVGRYGHRTILF